MASSSSSCATMRLDARNFFNFTSSEPPPFKRNQFGGNLGGPIRHGQNVFLFLLRRPSPVQDLSLNSVVLSEPSAGLSAMRGRETDRAAPASRTSSTPQGRRASSVRRSAPVNDDQWGIDINHILNTNGRLHGYYGFNRISTLRAHYAGKHDLLVSVGTFDAR